MSYTLDSLDKLKTKAVANYKITKKFIRRLKHVKPAVLDKKMLELNNNEFELIDCLECANCCKSISPAMYASDVRRMASAVKMKVPDFIDKYLDMDDDEEYVFKIQPCPFLGVDNYCEIYSSRPKACRGYPHTDRKRFHQILDITATNTKFCPAVFNIIEKLKDEV